MTASEFRATLDRMGLSQVATAALLGVSVGTVNRWATGARAVHPCAARLVYALECADRGLGVTWALTTYPAAPHRAS